jgi:hypothetical protein
MYGQQHLHGLTVLRSHCLIDSQLDRDPDSCIANAANCRAFASANLISVAPTLAGQGYLSMLVLGLIQRGPVCRTASHDALEQESVLLPQNGLYLTMTLPEILTLPAPNLLSSQHSNRRSDNAYTAVTITCACPGP